MSENKEIQLRASETEVALEAINDKGEKQVYCRVPAIPKGQSGSDETFFFHVAVNTIGGQKTGEVLLLMFAGNWPEKMKQLSATVAREMAPEIASPDDEVGQDTVVTGITIEAYFAKAIQRVCGDAIGEEWFQDPKHFAMALFQTPEIQQMLVPSDQEPVDKGRPDLMAPELGKRNTPID